MYVYWIIRNVYFEMMAYTSLFCEFTVIIYTFSLSDNNSLIFIFFLLLLCFLFEEVFFFFFSFSFTRSHTAHKFWRQSWASLVRLYADQISFIFKSVSAGGVEGRTFLFYHSSHRTFSRNIWPWSQK